MATWDLEETFCHFLICNGGSCMRRQAEEVTQAIRDEIALLGADRQIHTTRTRCNGRCADACVVIVYPEGVWYKEVTPGVGRELVRRHAAGHRLEERIVYRFEQRFVATGLSVAGQEKQSVTAIHGKGGSTQDESRSDSDIVRVPGKRENNPSDPNAERLFE